MKRLRILGLTTVLTGFLLFAFSVFICVNTYTWSAVAGILTMLLGIEVLFAQIESE